MVSSHMRLVLYLHLVFFTLPVCSVTVHIQCVVTHKCFAVDVGMNAGRRASYSCGFHSYARQRFELFLDKTNFVKARSKHNHSSLSGK